MIYKLINRAVRHPISNESMPDTFPDDGMDYETQAYFQRRLADGDLVAEPAEPATKHKGEK